MVNFHIKAEMGKKGVRSLLPKTCDIEASFHFVGNKIKASVHSVYDNPIFMPDSIVDSHDERMMAKVRPTPLPYAIKRACTQNTTPQDTRPTPQG